MGIRKAHAWRWFVGSRGGMGGVRGVGVARPAQTLRERFLSNGTPKPETKRGLSPCAVERNGIRLPDIATRTSEMVHNLDKVGFNEVVQAVDQAKTCAHADEGR